MLFLLWLRLFILCGVISPLISSSILGTYQPGDFIFQCPIFLHFHTVHGGSVGHDWATELNWTTVYSVQSLSRVWLFATPWTEARQASLSITNSQSLLKLMSIALVMPSNHLILCNPLLLLPSIFASISIFSSKSVLHIMWPKYWSFSFSISPSNEFSGLISFRIDWLDLVSVQGMLKSLLQHHSSKASILLCSAFIMVQLSHPYMTTGKTIALTRWTFAGKVMSLLFSMLSIGYTFSSKEQSSFNFMATVTICSDFWSPRKLSLSLFPLFPHLFAMKWWDWMPWS